VWWGGGGGGAGSGGGGMGCGRDGMLKELTGVVGGYGEGQVQ